MSIEEAAMEHGTSRRPIVYSVVLVVAVAAATLLTWATAGGSQAAPVAHHLVYFNADDTGATEQLDLGSKGMGPGDVILENNDWLDPKTMSKVGSAITRITVMRSIGKDDFLYYLDCTATVPGGQIVFTGAGKFSDLSTPAGSPFVVAGGTGIYAHATGTVLTHIEKLGTHPGGKLTFDITSPGKKK